MVVLDFDVRVPLLHLSKVISRQCINGKDAADLRLIRVVAVLVQTTHGIQQIIESQNVRRILKAASQPGDTDTGTSGNAVQNLPQVEYLAHIFQAQRGDVVIPANHEIRNARLVSDGQIGDRLRQMQGFQNAAVGQLDTGHRRPLKVQMLDVCTAGHIHSLLEVRTVADIQRPQQGVVAQVQFGQVAVGVTVCRITDFQALKPGGHGEIRIAHHQPGKVADGLKLAGTVDINLGVIQDGVGDYIRTAQSGIITMTTDTYPVLRRIMAIYHLSGDNCGDDSVQRIADETGMDTKTVRRYIAIGTLNERRVDFYRQYDEDGEETAEDISVDTTSQPDKLYFRAVLYDALHEAYDSLTYREQHTVAKHLGFCDTCWSVRKAVLINGEIEYRPIRPMTFEEISHSASRRSDKASERTYNNALEKMRKALLSYLELWQ